MTVLHKYGHTKQGAQEVTESSTSTVSTTTTQWTWTPDNNNNDYDSGDYNPGQWEWKPPTTTTTETSFIETSHVQEPLSGDFKVRIVDMETTHNYYNSD